MDTNAISELLGEVLEIYFQNDMDLFSRKTSIQKERLENLVDGKDVLTAQERKMIDIAFSEIDSEMEAEDNSQSNANHFIARLHLEFCRYMLFS